VKGKVRCHRVAVEIVRAVDRRLVAAGVRSAKAHQCQERRCGRPWFPLLAKDARNGAPSSYEGVVEVEVNVNVKGNGQRGSFRTCLASLRSADSRGGCLYVSCGAAYSQQVPCAPLARFGMTNFLTDCGCEELRAPDALLGIERGEHHRLVVNCRRMAVDGGSGLGAEVAVADVEIERADVVGAAGAGELHAALDASDGVVSLHNSSVIVCQESGAHVGGAAKVMRSR
jgi:hypothetical protein